MTTHLPPLSNQSEAEKQAIRYWIGLGCDIVACDSVNKKPLEQWGDNINKDGIDYEDRLEQGFYDKGVAIICCQIRRGAYEGKYIGGLDFDNQEAITNFCELGGFDLKRLASKTRVEWHKNPGKIHVLFITGRPFKNMAAGKGLEVMGEKKLFFVSSSIHKDGNPYVAFDTEQIAILDNVGQMRIENLIESFMVEIGCSYLSEDAKNQYFQYLEQDDTILKEGERHNAITALGTSYFFRYTGEWETITDEHRLEKLIAFDKKHCKPPLYDSAQEEFLDIWKWIIANCRRKSDQEREDREKDQDARREEGSGNGNNGNNKQAMIVLQIAENECEEFFMEQYRVPYAAVKIRGHIETLPLNSGRFRNWICKVYYELKGSVPNSESITNALNVLKAKADFKGRTKELHLRVACYVNTITAAGAGETTIYYDLTNPEWEAVKITSEKWSIEKAPIMFRRYNNQQPQVYPSKEYPADIFDRFMEIINITDEENKLLLKCSIIASFIPEIPLAILMLHGEQGGAKSTLQELVKMLVDPSSIRTLAFPKDINELIQQLAHNYAAYFDNISRIPDWISDQLCRAVTGSGFSKRQLYTDDDDIIYNFKRRLGFNGINLAATKADLLDRGLIIKLERIPDDKKRELVDIWNDFEKIRPELLGYIFDILVKVLRMRQSDPIELKKLPRMADFAKNAEIISRCMGNRDNLFLEVYYKNIELQTEELLESSPVATAIVKFMAAKGEWKGSATELLGELEPIATELKINTKSKLWPKSPNVLSRKITEVKTNLREVGILIEKEADPHTRVKAIQIRKISFESLESFDKQNHVQKEDKESNDIANNNSDIDTISFDNNTQNHAQNCSSNDMNDMNDICVGSTNPLPRDISKRGDFENRSRPNRTKMSVNATHVNTNHPNLSSLENERSHGSHRELNNGQNNLEVYHCKHCEYFTYFERELGKHLVRRHPDIQTNEAEGK